MPRPNASSRKRKAPNSKLNPVAQSNTESTFTDEDLSALHEYLNLSPNPTASVPATVKPTPTTTTTTTATNKTKAAATNKSTRSRKQSQPQQMTNDQQKAHRLKNQLQQEIITLQNTVHNIIPKLPFSRVIKECLMKYVQPGANFRITSDALQALQESSELYLTQLFEDSYQCTLHRNRVTLLPKDIQLSLLLRGNL